MRSLSLYILSLLESFFAEFLVKVSLMFFFVCEKSFDVFGRVNDDGEFGVTDPFFSKKRANFLERKIKPCNKAMTLFFSHLKVQVLWSVINRFREVSDCFCKE